VKDKCPVCRKYIKVLIAVCGYKAICGCPKVYGLGYTEPEAIASLLKYVEK